MSQPLPPGYIAEFDANTQRPYYVNLSTGVTTWTLPPQQQQQQYQYSQPQYSQTYNNPAGIPLNNPQPDYHQNIQQTNLTNNNPYSQPPSPSGLHHTQSLYRPPSLDAYSYSTPYSQPNLLTQPPLDPNIFPQPSIPLNDTYSPQPSHFNYTAQIPVNNPYTAQIPVNYTSQIPVNTPYNSVPYNQPQQNFQPPYQQGVPLSSYDLQTIIPSFQPPPYHIELSGVQVEQKVETLYGALKGDLDSKTLIRILSSSSPIHLRQLTTAYQKKHGKSLVDSLKNKIMHPLFLSLCNEAGELDAYWINKSCVGIGTNKDALIEILVGRTNDEIASIVGAYRFFYHKELVKELKSELSGCFEDFFVKGVLQGRGNVVNEVLIDVNALFGAGQKRIGTDEKVFINIFCTRPISHLKDVFEVYKRTHQKDITSVVKSEFSGSIETALLETIKNIYDQPNRSAEYLYSSMKGLGTNDDRLRRVIVSNRDPKTMAAIKDAFLRKYNQSLEQWVRDDTSGDYRTFLLELIGVYN